MKNIIILTGSAHKNGTSLLLADEFEKGAISAGNKVKRYDTAFLKINGCINCNHCKMSEGNCIQNDAFASIKNDLIQSDVVVFVTPVYYFGISSQLKAVIDRFHGISNNLAQKQRSAVLISTQASDFDSTYDALVCHYNSIIDYLGWKDIGKLNAKGVPTKESIENTDYPRIANELGKNIF